jgi:hypothetical protein
MEPALVVGLLVNPGDGIIVVDTVQVLGAEAVLVFLLYQYLVHGEAPNRQAPLALASEAYFQSSEAEIIFYFGVERCVHRCIAHLALGFFKGFYYFTVALVHHAIFVVLEPAVTVFLVGHIAVGYSVDD